MKLLSKIESFLFSPNKKKDLSSVKIIHLYKIRKKVDGSYIGLNVSSELTAEFQRKCGFDAKAVGVLDANGIDKILFQERPSHLVVKAFWITEEKLRVLAKKYPSCKFIITCHSKPTFLGQEGNGFFRINELVSISKDLKNVIPASNNKDAIFAFSNAFDTYFQWAPNTIGKYNVEENIKYVDENAINIGLFCAIRPLKNMVNQTMSAIAIAKKLNKKLYLHIISDRVELDGANTLKNIREIFKNLDSEKYQLIEHDWLEHDDFLQLISCMDLILQVSFTESFNIVLVDALCQKIPFIGSTAIEWIPSYLKANPDNINNIVNLSIKILKLNKFFKNINELICKIYLIKYNYFAIKEWYKIVEGSKKW